MRHLLSFLFNFFWTQIALASANRHGLHRHGYDVLYLVCVNVGGATQRRLQLHIVVFDPDFHLKVGDLFLCAGAGCLSRVTNLINGAVEFPIAIGVDFYFSLVTQLHIHNVVLVHIDPRLHVTEVGNAHYFRAGELPRGYKTFAQFAVENCDRAVNGRVNRRLGQLIPRLTRASLGALDFVERTFVGVLCHIICRLGRIIFLLRDELFVEQIFRSFEIVLTLQHRRFLLEISSFRCADSRFLLFEKRFIRVRLNFHQQVAFLDPHPVLDGQFNNFASDFG